MTIKNAMKAKKLGDLLVEVGLITTAQLQEAAEVQRSKGGKLGDVLTSLKFLSREVLLSFLGKRCGVSYVALSEYGAVSPEVLSLVPESVARQQQLLPLHRRDNELTVAMADPLNVFATDDLKILTGCEIKVVIAAEGEIKAAIETYYSEVCAVPSVDGQVRFEPPSEEPPALEARESQAVNLLNLLLDSAARAEASALHLEPGEDSIKVRYRLGGRLLPRPEISGKFQEGLAARVKALAHMNPFETWAPQEGHIRAKVSGRETDIRVSTLPTFYGEKIVLRFVEDAGPALDLEHRGFDEADLSRVFKALEAPGGLVLIAGPAGSGKSDTFCASLLHLLRPDRHVATLEDPVERCLPGVIQVQARPHVGLTVASGVRSLLRQDPDVIGVGEIRTSEEAQAVLEAVQAGVPVVATLRVPSATRVMGRFADLGISAEPLSAALKALVFHRWARTLCPSCREPYNLPRQTLVDMGFSEATLKALNISGSVSLFRAKGCGLCGKTGYHGRALLAVITVVDEDVRAELRKGAAGRLPTAAALRDAAFKKALEGTISLDETLR